jgi:hypothetical protein
MHVQRSITFATLAGLTLALAACNAAGPAASATVMPSATMPGQTAAATAGGGDSTSLGEPIQLSFDPCTLVTPDEATQALGIDVNPLKTDNGGGGACNYLGVGSPSHLLASLPSVADCKLLFLQIDNNLFGDVQHRIDGIGDGGMLVAGEGNLQIAVHQGCIELDGATADGPLPDTTMLDLARTAVARVP